MPPTSQNPQPYNLLKAEQAYVFETDHGLIYACGFRNLTSQLPPMLGVYDIHISDIEFRYFDPAPETKKPFDPRIEPTITGIMAEYFENESDVLIYLCDSADGRARERQALFTRWHRNVADLVDHEPMRIAFDEYVVYGGILTRRDFPHPEILQRELKDNAAKLILEKFGGFT